MAAKTIEIYYGNLEMGRATGRSESSARQWPEHLPIPDSITIGKKDALGWRLSTWREFAESRKSADLREDLLAAIAKLEKEADEKRKQYLVGWPTIKPLPSVRKPKETK